MRLLLDSQAVIWFLLGNRKMSRAALRAVESSKNFVFVSAVSGYEIALKAARGHIDPTLADQLLDALRQAHMAELPVTIAHAKAAAELPNFHKDPWDRILAAQARIENMLLVSSDEIFQVYGVRTLW